MFLQNALSFNNDLFLSKEHKILQKTGILKILVNFSAEEKTWVTGKMNLGIKQDLILKNKIKKEIFEIMCPILK